MKYLLILIIGLIPILLSAQKLPERKHYVCYQTNGAMVMDGQLDEKDWNKAAWSSYFVDIEGTEKPVPRFQTRMKMLWDEEFLYIAIWMEEPHLWATYTERESVIFHENDIEIFMDPDGDTHHYYELEINALGTEWDLLMTQPYRNGGKPINGWNINGLKKGIHLGGTLNDPSDVDQSWTVELAIPWKALSQSGPHYTPPQEGEQWRINFSRVQWQLDVQDGKYVKKINPETGKPYPEDNWVWSPQGVIDMHRPEKWGYVQFTQAKVGGQRVAFTPNPDEEIKDLLRKWYYLQHDHYKKHGQFAPTLKKLDKKAAQKAERPVFEVSASRFKMSLPSSEKGKNWHITEDSRIWKD